MTVLRRIWELLREAAGETAYERYCRRLRQRRPGPPLPSEKQFYLERLHARYEKPSRCC